MLGLEHGNIGLALTSVGAATDVQAGSILGFAAIGARSHQYCMLRIGQELAARGHTFTLLVSDLENLSIHELGSKAFPGLNIVPFKGPPGIGTKEWYEQLSRDLTTVCIWSDHFRHLLWAFLACL